MIVSACLRVCGFLFVSVWLWVCGSLALWVRECVRLCVRAVVSVCVFVCL